MFLSVRFNKLPTVSERGNRWSRWCTSIHVQCAVQSGNDGRVLSGDRSRPGAFLRKSSRCRYRPEGKSSSRWCTMALPLRLSPVRRCLRLPLQLLRNGSEWSATEKRHPGDHEHAESVAQRAQKESVSYQRRKDYASDNHENDPHASVHVVREREAAAKKGEQDDLGAP